MIPNILLRAGNKAVVDTTRVFSLFTANGSLNPTLTANVNNVALAPNSARFLAGKFLTFASNAKYIPEANDFSIQAEFTIHSNVNGTLSASGASITTLISWNPWLATGTLNNYEVVINNLNNTFVFNVDNFNSIVTASFPYTFAKNRKYTIKLERIGNKLSFHVDSVKIQEITYTHTIQFRVDTPLRVGRRIGGTNNAYWDSDMTLTALTIDIFPAD